MRLRRTGKNLSSGDHGMPITRWNDIMIKVAGTWTGWPRTGLFLEPRGRPSSGRLSDDMNAPSVPQYPVMGLCPYSFCRYDMCTWIKIQISSTNRSLKVIHARGGLDIAKRVLCRTAEPDKSLVLCCDRKKSLKRHKALSAEVLF